MITTLPPGSDTAPHKIQHSVQQFIADWQAILSSPLKYWSGGWSPSGPGTNPPHGGQLVSPWTASTSGPSCLLPPLGGAFPFTGLVRLALGTEPSHHAGLLVLPCGFNPCLSGGFLPSPGAWGSRWCPRWLAHPLGDVLGLGCLLCPGLGSPCVLLLGVVVFINGLDPPAVSLVYGFCSSLQEAPFPHPWGRNPSWSWRGVAHCDQWPQWFQAVISTVWLWGRHL